MILQAPRNSSSFKKEAVASAQSRHAPDETSHLLLGLASCLHSLSRAQGPQPFPAGLPGQGRESRNER